MARSVVCYNGSTFDYSGGTVSTFPAAVSSVFGRTGAVVAANGDYTAAQVGALSSSATFSGDGSGTVPALTIVNGAVTNAKIANSARARDYRSLGLIANLIWESFPHPLISANGGILSTGRLSAVAIPVLNGDVITNVAYLSATSAATPTHWWFALLDTSKNVIRQSTDQLTGAWGANTIKTLAVDSLPVTAGSRSGTTTVTLTFPTLSQSLTSLIAVNDSVVVSNANIAAYNGTFTVATVSSTQITYTAGSSATDSLAAPFPTVQLAAGKRTYTVSADTYVYSVVMIAGTVCTLASFAGFAAASGTGFAPTIAYNGNSTLTGTCPSPTTEAAITLVPWSGLS